MIEPGQKPMRGFYPLGRGAGDAGGKGKFCGSAVRA